LAKLLVQLAKPRALFGTQCIYSMALFTLTVPGMLYIHTLEMEQNFSYHT